MVHGKNRNPYWIDRRLNGLAGPEYHAIISFGLPLEPEDSQYGKSRVNACLTALAHQPQRWYSYQDWGKGGPVRFLAERGIEFFPRPDRNPQGRGYYDGCGCGQEHWRVGNR